MRIVNKIVVLFIVSIGISCEDMVDYSPYVIDFNDENKNVNQRNIEKLYAQQNDDTITIAFTGDTHRFYDDFEDFVNKVNENNAVDFVIHVGDIADFGLPRQYLWGNSYLLKLNSPYFVLIGNHDLVGNGFSAYNEMFGLLDFSFIYNRVKFIFLNTNGREFRYSSNVPDIEWLNGQLQLSLDFDTVIVLFHVPPTDGDFNSLLESDFQKALARYDNVLFTVHGHLHGHEVYKLYADSITYINVFGVEHKKYNLVKISNNQFELETIEF